MKNKLLGVLGFLYGSVVVGKEKAVVAFIVASLTAFTVKHGFTLDVTLQAIIQSVLYGILAHIAVYSTHNT